MLNKPVQDTSNAQQCRKKQGIPGTKQEAEVAVHDTPLTEADLEQLSHLADWLYGVATPGAGVY